MYMFFKIPGFLKKPGILGNISLKRGPMMKIALMLGLSKKEAEFARQAGLHFMPEAGDIPVEVAVVADGVVGETVEFAEFQLAAIEAAENGSSAGRPQVEGQHRYRILCHAVPRRIAGERALTLAARDLVYPTGSRQSKRSQG